jgi:carbohydrate-binding DOMON domain-containing protein
LRVVMIETWKIKNMVKRARPRPLVTTIEVTKSVSEGKDCRVTTLDTETKNMVNRARPRPLVTTRIHFSSESQMITIRVKGRADLHGIAASAAIPRLVSCCGLNLRMGWSGTNGERGSLSTLSNHWN